MTYTFTIPGLLPGLNEIIDAARKNRFEAAAQKKEYTDLVHICARAARLPHLERVNVNITWYEQEKRRDKDNVQAGCKFVLDGIVAAGILKNDGWKQIGDIKHDVQVDRKNPRVVVELEEAEVEE